MLWFLWNSGLHPFASNKKAKLFNGFNGFNGLNGLRNLRDNGNQWFEWLVKERRRRLAVESLRRRLFAEGDSGITRIIYLGDRII